MQKKYDWQAIQKSHDEGSTWRELTNTFGICMAALAKAKKRGDLITRSQKTAKKLHDSTHPPRKQSEETKQKLSKIRLEYLKNNPDKVPYLLNHYSKRESYPEKYFTELFLKENIVLTKQYQVSFYCLDFCDIDKKKYVEIDGEQHYVDPKIVESDKRRTEYLESLGWESIRIRWSHYQKLNFDSKKQFIQDLKGFLENKNLKPILLVKEKIINKTPKLKVRRFEVSKEELEKLIKEMPMIKIGKMFGVSDNAIKRRAKLLDIVIPDMRGYWTKLKAGLTK